MLRLSGHRKTAEDWIIDTVNISLMVVLIGITLYPFYYILILSFNNGIDSAAGGVYFFPRKPTLLNYTTVFEDNRWMQALWVSIGRTVIGTAASVFFTSLIAYAMSFSNLKFRKGYFMFFLISMYFSGGLIPYYFVLRGLMLLNTFWVYIIPAMFSVFNMLIMMAFFRELPSELHESASLDGANDLVIFFRIIIPCATPVLATVALFNAVGQWNNWFDTAFFAPMRQDLHTLAYKMMMTINTTLTSSSSSGGVSMAAEEGAGRSTQSTTQSIQYATIIISVVPILLVYPFLQKYFVKGVLLGSVKG